MTPLRTLPRKTVLLCAALATVAAGCVLVAAWHKQPNWRGKAWEYWLDRLPATMVRASGKSVSISSLAPAAYLVKDDLGYIAAEHEAEKAVDALGPIQLDTLISRLRSKETIWTRFRRTLEDWSMMVHIKKSISPLHFPAVRRGQAVTALVRLGDKAKPVLPAIIRLAKVDPDSGVRASALEIILRLSPSDYPEVTNEQDSREPGTR